jgi:hypothetical protein
MFQVQVPQAELDFDLVFQEAARGHWVVAENLFGAAMEKYFVAGQTPPKEAVSGMFWKGSGLFAGLQRGHRYQDLERVINDMLPLLEATQFEERSKILSLYVGLLADSYRAEADYEKAARNYERARSLGALATCGHPENFIGVTEVYLAQDRLGEAGSWLQPVLEQTLASCDGVPADTRLFSSLAVIYRLTGQTNKAQELGQRFPAHGDRTRAAVEQGLLSARVRAAKKDFDGSDLIYRSTLGAIPSGQLFWSIVVLDDYAQTLRNYGRTTQANAVDQQLLELRETSKKDTAKNP